MRTELRGNGPLIKRAAKMRRLSPERWIDLRAFEQSAKEDIARERAPSVKLKNRRLCRDLKSTLDQRLS